MKINQKHLVYFEKWFIFGLFLVYFWFIFGLFLVYFRNKPNFIKKFRTQSTNFLLSKLYRILDLFQRYFEKIHCYKKNGLRCLYRIQIKAKYLFPYQSLCQELYFLSFSLSSASPHLQSQFSISSQDGPCKTRGCKWKTYF